MLVPVGVDLRHPVQLVFSADPTLSAVSARLRRREDDETFVVELFDASPLAVPDARVVLQGGPFGDTRLLGVIEAVTGTRVVVRQKAAQSADDRKSPRTTGLLHVRWRALRPDEKGQPADWLRKGRSVAAADAWSTPELEMDVSLAGLRFRDDAPCAAGDRLLVELGIPGEIERHRCSGVVVRELQGPRGREVAIELHDLSEGAEDALMDVLLDA